MRRSRAAALRAATALALAGTLALAPAGAAAGAPASTSGSSSTSSTGTSTSTPGGSTAAGATLPVRVRLAEVSPAAYSRDPAAGGTTVTVRGTVRNEGTTALDGVSVQLLVQRSALRTRQAVAAWADAGDGDGITSPSAARAAPGDDPAAPGVRLEPGQELPFVLTAAATALGTAAGAHAAAVEVLADGERAGLARTYLTAAPAAGVQRTGITLLAPLVAPRPLDEDPADGLADPAALAGEVTGGSLGAVLAATDDPRVSWALDPALLQAADAVAGGQGGTGQDGGQDGAPPPADPGGPSEGTTDGTAGSADATAVAEWLARLRESAAGRDVVALPFADPDLAALARSRGGSELLEAAERAGESAAALLGSPVLDDVAWPAGGAGDVRTTSLAAAAGDTAVVLDEGAVPADPDLTYTPTGRSTVATDSGDVAGLVADAALSRALTTAAEDGQEVTAVQRFLAEAATTTLQRPSDSRSLLAVAPRGWSPAPGTVTALLAALDDSPWARVQPLSALRAQEAPEGVRSTPEDDAEKPARRLPGAHVQALLAAQRRLDALAGAVEGTDPRIAADQRAVLALASVAWRGRTTQLTAARERLEAATAALLDGVRIAAGSDLNLVATRSDLPVTVVNELDLPLVVELSLRPRTARLQLERSTRLTLQPRSQQRVGVPVEALANGTVLVDAQLRTPDGTALGAPAAITVNVSRSVESWIVGGGAAAAGLLLVVGLVRAVRRGRRRMDEAEVVVPAPEHGADGRART